MKNILLYSLLVSVGAIGVCIGQGARVVRVAEPAVARCFSSVSASRGVTSGACRFTPYLMQRAAFSTGPENTHGLRVIKTPGVTLTTNVDPKPDTWGMLYDQLLSKVSTPRELSLIKGYNEIKYTVMTYVGGYIKKSEAVTEKIAALKEAIIKNPGNTTLNVSLGKELLENMQVYAEVISRAQTAYNQALAYVKNLPEQEEYKTLVRQELMPELKKISQFIENDKFKSIKNSLLTDPKVAEEFWGGELWCAMAIKFLKTHTAQLQKIEDALDGRSWWSRWFTFGAKK